MMDWATMYLRPAKSYTIFIQLNVVVKISFFFLYVHTKGKWLIQTNDLRFIRCGFQPIELLFEDNKNQLLDLSNLMLELWCV